MARVKPGVMSASERDLLRTLGGTATGPVVWSYARPRLSGVIPVSTFVGTADGASLRFYAAERKSDQPSMQYLVNGVAAYRVDVNAIHNGDARATHWHQYLPDGTEECIQEDLGITLAWGTIPTAEQYREVTQRFATHVNVKLPTDFWTDLPRGWMPC